jgi:transposase
MRVLRIFETKSVIKMQRRYRTQYGQDPASDNAMRRWLKKFQETGSVLHRKGAGRPSTSQEDVYRILEAWISYVSREALMLKLFSILQY